MTGTHRMPTFHPQQSSPRSVYIHIPFCRHRCGYCNFSLVAGRDYLVDRFLDALEKEIGWLEKSYQVDTVFFGGGTPSHLSFDDLTRLNSIVRSRFEFSQTCEVTAECNPSDLTEARAAALKSCGVNRISLGAQSLIPEKLNTLERDHSAEIVNTAVSIARSFAKSVSLDMIFAAPNETPAQWSDDLSSAIQLEPDHFSTYELTYEKGTRFWNRKTRNELVSASEDLRCHMYEHAIDTLSENGFQQYEISSFAKPGHECFHNKIYWSGDAYFAFGPGASRYIDGIRETNHQSTTRYMQLIEAGKSPAANSEKLDPKSSARELLAIGLRKMEGVDLHQFKIRTGFEVNELLGETQTTLLQSRLIQFEEDRISLTRSGILVCDSIASEILK